jgi:predicted AAA+ superfamily ATPase
MKYIERQLQSKLSAYVKQFPVVVLTGARQTGKSTLLKHLFTSGKWEYISLDQRGTLERLNADPDLFVKDINSNIIIDEAQKSPALFHAIKWRVDEGMKHKVILSGSANLQLLHRVSETLAGRAGILELYTLSLAEKYEQKKNILDILLTAKDINTAERKIKEQKVTKDDFLFDHILWGGYPKITEYKNVSQKQNWLENYRTTYIERDLRDVANIAELTDFQKFYQSLAFQAANILNLSNIASDIGVSVPTCKKYIQILQASYQYFLLQPYHINVHKRLIKLPKVYIFDTGLANYFLGYGTVKELQNSGKFGNILENSVISEMVKQNSLLKQAAKMYFWRTSNGAEIDLIIERGERILPVEIKSAVNVAGISLRGLYDFLEIKTQKRIPFGVIFYRGSEVFKLNEKVLAVPIGCL